LKELKAAEAAEAAEGREPVSDAKATPAAFIKAGLQIEESQYVSCRPYKYRAMLIFG
jgi:hypothetical protein